MVISQPTLLTATLVKNDVQCNGGNDGSVTLTVNGGTPNYTYVWNDAITSQNRVGLTAGAYAVTVKDANNCSVVLNTTITQPAVLATSETHTNILCNGNSTGARIGYFRN